MQDTVVRHSEMRACCIVLSCALLLILHMSRQTAKLPMRARSFGWQDTMQRYLRAVQCEFRRGLTDLLWQTHGMLTIPFYMAEYYTGIEYAETRSSDRYVPVTRPLPMMLRASPCCRAPINGVCPVLCPRIVCYVVGYGDARLRTQIVQAYFSLTVDRTRHNRSSY